MQAVAAGTWTGLPLAIGAPYEGGYYAGQISTSANSVATHNLVVGPLSTAQNTSVQWKTTNTTTDGTSSVIDGPSNSAVMNDANHPAAQFCEGLTIGGYSDWYMPAKDELEVCYYNLKPTTGANATEGGANPYSVPARASNYTSGIPTQTSAAAFRSGGSEAFSGVVYWASTQSGFPQGARGLDFSNGYFSSYYKNSSRRVRAIRRVAV